MKQNKTLSHFTLIELMVVVAIIAIIMGITLPAFNNVILGSAVDRSARMVSAQLSLARAEAIAKRRPVALFFPGEDCFQARIGTDKQAYNYSSFRAAYVSSNGSGTYAFEKWVPGTSWTFLPKGAIIAKVSADVDDTLSGSYGSYTPKTLEKTDMKDASANTMDINIGASGDEDNLSKEFSSRYIVFEKNGSCNSEIYITLCEGVAVYAQNGTGCLINIKSDNMDVIHVNQFTGKVEFIYPNAD